MELVSDYICFVFVGALTVLWWIIQKERDHMNDLDVDGRIIVKLM